METQGERLDSYICSETWLEYSPSNASARCVVQVGSGKKALFSLTNCIKITTEQGEQHKDTFSISQS